MVDKIKNKTNIMNTMIHSNKPSHQISVLSFLVIIEKMSPTKENTGPSTIISI